jgi:gas vesicle protein
MRRFTSFIVGALLGGLVGTALAMLFAPSSGELLRQQVVDYSSRVREEVRQASFDKRIELEKQLAGLRAPSQGKPE